MTGASHPPDSLPTTPLSPSNAILLRIRYIEQQRLAEVGQSRCDRCEKAVPKAKAIESWQGDRCIYVVCLGCLQSSGLHVSWAPDGLEFSTDDGAASVCIRSASSSFPSTQRPRGASR